MINFKDKKYSNNLKSYEKLFNTNQQTNPYLMLRRLKNSEIQYNNENEYEQIQILHQQKNLQKHDKKNNQNQFYNLVKSTSSEILPKISPYLKNLNQIFKLGGKRIDLYLNSPNFEHKFVNCYKKKEYNEHIDENDIFQNIKYKKKYNFYEDRVEKLKQKNNKFQVNKKTSINIDNRMYYPKYNIIDKHIPSVKFNEVKTTNNNINNNKKILNKIKIKHNRLNSL
jgi:hypothetical protein